MKHLLHHGACALLVAALTACATPSPDGERLGASFIGKSYVLLGEVHDNAEGQRQRLAALTYAIEQGWRPAIAMEQFDRERQADIDRARRERPLDADYLIAQAGSGSWKWPQYQPVVALALRHDLPLIAANFSREDAGKVVRKGLAAAFTPEELAQLGLDRPLAPDLTATQTAILDRGHCGNFPKVMLPGMLAAQAARDAVMASALKPHAARGAVLIAGNGHVRADIGVPRWLGAAPQEILAVGYLEDDAASAADEGPFDRVRTAPPVARPDPCRDAKPQG